MKKFQIMQSMNPIVLETCKPSISFCLCSWYLAIFATNKTLQTLQTLLYKLYKLYNSTKTQNTSNKQSSV